MSDEGWVTRPAHPLSLFPLIIVFTPLRRVTQDENRNRKSKRAAGSAVSAVRSRRKDRRCLLARARQLTTSDGITGFGYVVAPGSSMLQAMASATRELSQSLVGMHVLETEAAWERLARKGSWVGPGGLLHQAIAPLDIAMWDAAGKTLKQPLYRLLGG